MVRRRVHPHTRLTETPQQAFKSVWNYISSVLWTTYKLNLSQCCWKCHLSPPCLPSCSLARRASQILLYFHLTFSVVYLSENAVETIECHLKRLDRLTSCEARRISEKQKYFSQAFGFCFDLISFEDRFKTLSLTYYFIIKRQNKCCFVQKTA